MCMGPRIMQTTDEKAICSAWKMLRKGGHSCAFISPLSDFTKTDLKNCFENFFKAIFKFFTAIKIVCKADL